LGFFVELIHVGLSLGRSRVGAVPGAGRRAWCAILDNGVSTYGRNTTSGAILFAWDFICAPVCCLNAGLPVKKRTKECQNIAH
jgi:hypothetical protein